MLIVPNKWHIFNKNDPNASIKLDMQSVQDAPVSIWEGTGNNTICNVKSALCEDQFF